MSANFESFGTGIRQAFTGLILTITKPAGLVVGEFMLYIANVLNGGVDWVPPVGWTELGTADVGGGDPTIGWGYKFADAADVAAANFGFTSTGGANDAMGVIARYSGVDAVNIDGETEKATDFSNPALVTCPSVITSLPNLKILRIAASDAGGTTSTGPSGHIERIDFPVLFSSGNRAQISLYEESALQAVAEATGIEIISVDNLSFVRGSGITIALSATALWVPKDSAEPAATAATEGFGGVEFGDYSFGDGAVDSIWIDKPDAEPNA